ncbi:hypothetical protein, partial [Aquitalea magnusonii]|uniref:hypothetical protein n=1 Tax=Aquitalea magnusonii TaxID=332411 RepID=UPI00128F2DDD
MRSFLLLCCCLWLLPAQAADITLRAGVVVDNAGPYNFTPDSPMAGIYREALEQIGKLSGVRFDIEYYPALRIQQLFEVARLDVEVGVNPAWRSLSPVGGFYTLPIGTLDYQLCGRINNGRSGRCSKWPGWMWKSASIRPGAACRRWAVFTPCPSA